MSPLLFCLSVDLKRPQQHNDEQNNNSNGKFKPAIFHQNQSFLTYFYLLPISKVRIFEPKISYRSSFVN